MIDTTLFVAAGPEVRRFQREVVVAAPPSEVFHAWTTNEGVRAFLAIDSDVQLRIGGAYEWYFGPPEATPNRGSEDCRVLAYIPERMLAFSWNSPPQFPDERAEKTWVVVELEPAGEARTRVVLTHAGFGDGGRWAEVQRYFEDAWPKVLGALRARFGG